MASLKIVVWTRQTDISVATVPALQKTLETITSLALDDRCVTMVPSITT